jgi:hypothetical protein
LRVFSDDLSLGVGDNLLLHFVRLSFFQDGDGLSFRP